MMMKLVNLFLVLAVASAKLAIPESRELRMMKKKNGGGNGGGKSGKGKGKSEEEPMLITTTSEAIPFVFQGGLCFAPSTSGQTATCNFAGGLMVVGATELDGDYEACCPPEYFDVPAIIAAATASGELSSAGDVDPVTGATDCECIISGSPISGAGIIFNGVVYCMAGSVYDCP